MHFHYAINISFLEKNLNGPTDAITLPIIKGKWMRLAYIEFFSPHVPLNGWHVSVLGQKPGFVLHNALA